MLTSGWATNTQEWAAAITSKGRGFTPETSQASDLGDGGTARASVHMTYRLDCLRRTRSNCALNKAGTSFLPKEVPAAGPAVLCEAVMAPTNPGVLPSTAWSAMAPTRAAFWWAEAGGEERRRLMLPL